MGVCDMSLRDELNAVSKTKEEARDKQYKKDYEESYKSAEYVINGIKDTLMEKAKHGEYEKLASGKKYIQIEYNSVSMRYFMGLDFKIMKVISDDGRNERYYAKYYISSQGSYDGFVKRIMEFSLEEDVSFKIVCCYNRAGNERHEFNSVTGITFPCNGNEHESMFSVYISCSVIY